MFEKPKKTLQKSLFHVLENGQEYVADVCLDYPIKVWVHRAILLARVPQDFRKRYMSCLEEEKQQQEKQQGKNDSVSKEKEEAQGAIHIDISQVVPYNTLRPLLRFWYTADFTAPLDEASLLSSHVEGLTRSESSSALLDKVHSSIRQDIKQLEERLGLHLLPVTTLKGPTADFDQLTADLKRICDQRIATDAVLNIFSVPNKMTTKQQKEQTEENKTAFPAHRFILASQSKYFYSVFYTEFRDASISSVHMPGDQFSSTTLKIILNYFYTDSLILPSAPNEMLQTPKTSRLNEKKYELRLLQKVFDAGDFLGHFDTICLATLDRMSQICHEFKCICSDCAILLPSVLLFADKHEKLIPQLRVQLIRLYADPLDSIAPLWSQKPFALLVNSMLMAQQPQATPAAASQASAVNNNGNSTSIINNTNASNSSANNKDRISSIFSKKAPNSSSSILSNENTSSDSGTAIDPPSNLITEITERTFSNISKHNSVRVLHSLHLCFSHLRTVDRFPTWSSAVHNILNTYLHHTVDMISSHFDYYCVEYPILLSCIDGIGFGFSVDFLGFVLGKVLTEGLHDNNATVIYQCIIKDLGGRQEMYKNVAVDGVLLDARTKVTQYIGKRWVEIKAEGGFLTMEKDFLRILAEDINVPYRTLTKPIESDFTTMFNFKPRRSTATLSNESKTSISNQSRTSGESQREGKRTRSLSATSSHPDSILLHRNGNHSDGEDIVSTNTRRNSIGQQRTPLAYHNYGSSSSLTDALLPIEYPKTATVAKSADTPRPTRLRFALPDTPSRAKSPVLSKPAHKSSSKRRSKSPRKSRWLGNTSDSSDDEMVIPTVGAKVELLRRPLPTLGTIKYIGDVNFAKGTWVGIELESRVGNNDGSVEGKRYFQTVPQRGVFVKIDDFKIINTNDKKAK